MSLPLDPVLLGAALGASFNPLTAVAGSAVSAAIVGSPRTQDDRRLLAAGLLLVAWLLGDGLRVVVRAREVSDSLGVTAGAWPRLAPLAGWALVGLACYVGPAILGAFVGRRVTHGTGWLSAAAIAASLSLALSTAAPVLVEVLRGAAG